MKVPFLACMAMLVCVVIITPRPALAQSLLPCSDALPQDKAKFPEGIIDRCARAGKLCLHTRGYSILGQVAFCVCKRGAEKITADGTEYCVRQSICTQQQNHPKMLSTDGMLSTYSDLTVHLKRLRALYPENKHGQLFIPANTRSSPCVPKDYWTTESRNAGGEKPFIFEFGPVNPVACPPLSAPHHGTTFQFHNEPDVIAFTCDPGFTLKGAYNSRCAPDGTWSAQTPICVENKCALGPPANGEVANDELPTGHNGVPVDYEVKWKCNQGHIMFGPKSTKCEQSGTLKRPTCHQPRSLQFHGVDYYYFPKVLATFSEAMAACAQLKGALSLPLQKIVVAYVPRFDIFRSYLTVGYILNGYKEFPRIWMQPNMVLSYEHGLFGVQDGNEISRKSPGVKLNATTLCV